MGTSICVEPGTQKVLTARPEKSRVACYDETFRQAFRELMSQLWFSSALCKSNILPCMAPAPPVPWRCRGRQVLGHPRC